MTRLSDISSVHWQPALKSLDVVEAEGCEAVLPGIVQFFLMPLYSAQYQWESLGIGPRSHHVKKLALWLIERYQQPVVAALRRTGGKFDPPPAMKDLAAKADGIISLGTLAGEGWLLTAEMIELVQGGYGNIVCAQPFGCLPNHIVGKGMVNKIRALYPSANITPIDYDPSATRVNQENRIKLMLAVAKERLNAPAQAAPLTAEEIAGGAPRVETTV